MAFDRNKEIVVGIVAGEVSGDNLGLGIMTEMKKSLPNVRFVGIGGPAMISCGLQSLFSIEELSVMGLEVLRKLFRILSVRRQTAQQLKDLKVDLFIGIDAPDFNLYVEDVLKRARIPTVHYVCPSVWAWRPKRIYKIRRATDMVLSILPFEKEFCERYDTPCTFVGHPLADQIPEPTEEGMKAARERLFVPSDGLYLGVLPGSRHGEIISLSPIFLEACRKLQQKFPEIVFLIPIVNEKRKSDFMPLFTKYGKGLNIRIYDGQSRDVMTASNAVLLASGTATLECMLVGRPMVVGYKVSKFTEFIARRLLTVDYVSLPNLLLGRNCVRELLQSDCTSDNIAVEAERLLSSDNSVMLKEFESQRNVLRQNASKIASDTCISLLKSKIS